MTNLKVQLERVVKENERLHAELKESVEKQLHSLPVASGTSGGTMEEDAIIGNLQEQLELSEQERMKAMELWQTADQELDRLQRIHQQTVSDHEGQDAERRQLKVQQPAHTHCRLCQKDSCSCPTCILHPPPQEEELLEAQGRESAADRRLQQLQGTLSQLETRLTAASQEAEAVHREQAVWEKKVGELQARCTTLEEEKHQALSKVRENIQLAEEATLHKDQALLREKQKTEELEKTKEAFKLFIQEAAVRTRKEVENERKQCNIRIHRMSEELSVLQLECADKQSQIERSLRERKAVEEELERVYKEGRAEPELQKIDALHQRCLDAERLKDDALLTLQTTQKKLKKMEMEHNEELSRCQEEMRRLRSSLATAHNDGVSVSEERLQLQHENLQLRREMEELRKATMLVQKKAKQEVSQMEHEYSVKEQGLEARVRELEESSRSSSADLTRLLAAQQKSAQRRKEEAKNLNTFSAVLCRTELNRQKQRSRELQAQLERDHDTIMEYEKQLGEHQEKAGRLQRRLTQAEQKAASAVQQLGILTAQRRKTARIETETL
uniref:Sodium channel and clathrin linker 1 n=1 Tax=Oryzias sinensis TaxID=183150 RepID=A0A8C7ZZU0_9TELE